MLLNGSDLSPLFSHENPFRFVGRLHSQTALGLQDLGQLHYQPLKDSQGTMVISSTCHLANIKAIPPSLNFKWLPLSKLQQRRRQQQESETSSSSSSSPSASDLLIASLDEQISFQQVSSKPLRRGLYLGYLKMKSSVDLIRVLVPKDAPNLLPHWKIRDNPWVSRLTILYLLIDSSMFLTLTQLCHYCISVPLVKSGSGSRNWPRVKFRQPQEKRTMVAERTRTSHRNRQRVNFSFRVNCNEQPTNCWRVWVSPIRHSSTG